MEDIHNILTDNNEFLAILSSLKNGMAILRNGCNWEKSNDKSFDIFDDWIGIKGEDSIL